MHEPVPATVIEALKKGLGEKVIIIYPIEWLTVTLDSVDIVQEFSSGIILSDR